MTPVLRLLLHARDRCADAPEERARTLAEAAALAVTAAERADVAYYLGKLGGDRALGLRLAEDAEATSIAGGRHRELWSVALAWKALGEPERAQRALWTAVERTGDPSIATSMAIAWRSLFDDEAEVRAALERAEALAESSLQWLNVAEGYRDGGRSNRLDAWDREGVRRCLDAGLAAATSAGDRTLIANGFRQWLGDEACADAIAPAGRTHDEVPRLRKALPCWDTTRPRELWDAVVSRLSEADLEHVAEADYEADAPKHLAALRTILATGRAPCPLPWHPLEVVSLTRWSEPPKTSHAARAFACLVIQLGEPEETTISNSVGPLVESARALGLEDELERYLAWLAEVVPVEELGWPLLGLALSTLRRRPGSGRLAMLVDKLASLRLPRRYARDGEWSYPAKYGGRNELWASLVEEALAGREGRHEARLRALLGVA